MPPLVSTRIVADVHRGRAARWIYTALRTKSPAIQDALARAVRAGTPGAAELRAHVLEGGEVPTDAATLRVAAALGTIWAALGSGADDARAGQRLLATVADVAPEALSAKQQQIFAQVSFLLGEYGAVTHALERFPVLSGEVADALRTDLLNPTVAGPDRREEWLGRIAAPFLAAGLAPVEVDTDGETLFDGLRSGPVPDVDGPLVTVIMPCYRPDAGLLTSVRSMIAQSHRNLEVLLVDDASGPEYAALFEEATSLDPRVRLLPMDRNGGTYRCRNAALEVAQGTYVTVQDADDWSHPARLADQVRLLEENPSAGGSRSDAVRATDELTHQWVGYSPRRRNASSLMFRRSVVEQIGPFDLVRKSGDSEYYERLVRLAGPVLDTVTPLAVTRLRAGTLSRADFSFQWMAPDRLLYRAAYRSWHQTLTPGDLARSATPTGTRAFPAPASMLRDLPGGRPPTEVDLLFLLDAAEREAVLEVLRYARPGARVGVVHLEDPTRPSATRPEPVDELVTAAREGRLHMLSPTDELHARTTVVVSSGVLELAPYPAPRIQTAEVVLLARPATGLRDVQDHVSALDTCRTVLGTPARWVAASALDQEQLSRDGWDVPLLADVLPPAGHHGEDDGA